METMNFESLSTIVEETFDEEMQDTMNDRYQGNLDALRDSVQVAEYQNEPQEEYGLLEKALDESLLYAGCGPYRGGVRDNGDGSFSRYGDALNRYGYNAPYQHPNQDIGSQFSMPSMDHIQNRIQDEMDRRVKALEWDIERRKNDEPFQSGISMTGIKSSIHFHGSDPDHLSDMRINTGGNPFSGNDNYEDNDNNTKHPWADNGYNASMMDYWAEIEKKDNDMINRFFPNDKP